MWAVAEQPLSCISLKGGGEVDIMAHRKSVPLVWRRFEARYRLVGNKCEECDTIYFPPRSICPKCRRKGDLKKYRLRGKGRIHSYTIIHAPPAGFEKRVPYCIAIIELDEGPKITGEVVGDLKSIGIGKRVRATFRKIYEDGDDGIIHYGLKWELTHQDERFH